MIVVDVATVVIVVVGRGGSSSPASLEPVVIVVVVARAACVDVVVVAVATKVNKGFDTVIALTTMPVLSWKDVRMALEKLDGLSLSSFSSLVPAAMSLSPKE